MRARTKARKRALDILFESEARGADPLVVLKERQGTEDAPPVSEYAARLVEGVVERRERIDQLLTEHSEGWSVAQVLWINEIDDAVAITEAVELARTLSTDDSPRFVNGVLGRIADIAEHLRPGLAPTPADPPVDQER